ncbi:MAG: alginate export family protein [Pikeienuella sp.]
MSKQLKHSANLIAAAIMSLTAVATDAAGAGKAKHYGAPVFDIDKRKKTKTELTDWAAYSAYASTRYSGERNLNLDDNLNDKSDKLSGYVGVAVRAEPAEGFVGFLHAEAELTHRGTHKATTTTADLHIKEALVAYRLSATSTVSAGRLRIGDKQKWVADAAVDGVHLGYKADGTLIELGAFTGTRDNDGLYALGHLARLSTSNAVGAFGVLEAQDGEKRAHLSGYWADKPSDDLSYSFNAGVVVGDGANNQPAGVGFDARAIKKVGEHEWNPQLTVGIAAGSKGFAQTELHSNKTYDGGQTQFNRYGYVYQPELANMAVATLGVGIRPSRMFSLDLAAHAYSQIQPMTTTPDARVRGATNGDAAFLGGEISLVGAWRPTKKSKFEFGLSIFQAGPAYQNQETAKQAYARFSVYF